jgi:hypothetical protein
MHYPFRTRDDTAALLGEPRLRALLEAAQVEDFQPPGLRRSRGLNAAQGPAWQDAAPPDRGFTPGNTSGLEDDESTLLALFAKIIDGPGLPADKQVQLRNLLDRVEAGTAGSKRQTEMLRRRRAGG